MQRHYKLSVPKISSRTRLDKYLSRFIENASRTKVQKCINLGNVLVNGNCVKSNYMLKPYDEIEVELPVPEKQDILPEDILLDIVFEDKNLILINKPAGMVTHPAYKNYSGTLVNAIMYYAQKHNESLSNMNGFERAGIVHRLDKDTSGLLIVAKDEVTHRKLSVQFMNQEVDKEYSALIWGKFKNDSGVIESRIGRDRKDRKKMSVLKEHEEGGKKAITHYEVIEEYEFLSHIKLFLKTGRTHQIRVHLSSKGHPVFGDDTYGGRVPHSVNITSNIKARIKNLLDMMPRQALHAKTIGFVHPYSEEHIRFTTELPEDMRNIIEKVRT